MTTPLHAAVAAWQLLAPLGLLLDVLVHAPPVEQQVLERRLPVLVPAAKQGHINLASTMHKAAVCIAAGGRLVGMAARSGTRAGRVA